MAAEGEKVMRNVIFWCHFIWRRLARHPGRRREQRSGPQGSATRAPDQACNKAGLLRRNTFMTHHFETPAGTQTTMLCPPPRAAPHTAHRH